MDAQNDRRRGARYRVIRQCHVVWDGGKTDCWLEDISSIGALVLAPTHPPLGTDVTLYHPSAGAIGGTTSRLGDGNFAIAFAETEASVLYALKSITTDMTIDQQPSLRLVTAGLGQ